MVIGYIYMKSDWRLSSVFRLSRYSRYWKELGYKHRMKVINKKREKERRVMERVDQILDKINQVGFDNLTKEEKKTLEEASQLLSQQSERK
jgi:hypothetical protein